MYVDTRSYRPGYNPQFLRQRGAPTNGGKSNAPTRETVEAPNIDVLDHVLVEPVTPDVAHPVVTINGMAISFPKISIQAGDLE